MDIWMAGAQTATGKRSHRGELVFGTVATPRLSLSPSELTESKCLLRRKNVLWALSVRSEYISWFRTLRLDFLYATFYDQLADKPIERAIGRTIDTTGCHFDIRKSDLDGPYFYAWIFSIEYPSFPDNRFSKWTKAQLEACDEALEKGDLTVVAIDSRRLESGEWHTIFPPKPDSSAALVRWHVFTY
jgi:hypothetical protein